MAINDKHIDILQNNISRMNKCSFQMKGWSITVISALIALFASSVTEKCSGQFIYLYCAIGATFLFWFLDSLYLSKERKLIAIYNDVIGVGNGVKTLTIQDYEIPMAKYKGWTYSVPRAMLLPSEIVLYGLIIIGLVAIIYFM